MWSVSAGTRGVESLVRDPEPSSRGTGGRRKRKRNLPKLLPSQPFAEGGACGLADQRGGGRGLRY